MIRTVIAFLVAPLVSSVLFATVTTILMLVPCSLLINFSPWLMVSYFFYLLILLLFISLPFAYGATVILGIPLFLVFRHFGPLSRLALLLGASGIGLLTGIVFNYYFPSSKLPGLLITHLLFTVFGATSGYVFWFLAYRAPTPPLNMDVPPRAP